MTIKDILKGLTPQQMQSVGNMSVIPLTQESKYDEKSLIAPKRVHMASPSYGTMRFKNPDRETVLAPMGVTYMVDKKVQNHALPHAGIIKTGAKQYTSAACIQATQHGHITEDVYDFRFLPLLIREDCVEVSSRTDSGKLWPAISRLNAEQGLRSRGHLEYLYDHFQKELDEFVAEFEVIPNQVGAIVLINDKVVGIERTPSQQYWMDVWEPLIRDTYGSYALAKKSTVNSRVPLKTSARSLSGLRVALENADKKERKFAEKVVSEFISDNLTEKMVDRETTAIGELHVSSVGNNQVTGQIVKEGIRILYASLVIKSGWKGLSSSDRAWTSRGDFGF